MVVGNEYITDWYQSASCNAWVVWENFQVAIVQRPSQKVLMHLNNDS